MSRFRVPERYRLGLSTIAKVQENAIGSLATILSDGDASPTSVNSRILESSLHGNLHMPEEEARNLVTALRSVYRLWSGLDIPIEEFVSEIYEALLEEGVFKSSSDEGARFSERLLKLLSIDRFKMETKARDLQTEDERLYCRSRIITDIRPVFGDDPTKEPDALILVHHLKIVYHDTSAQHREFIVTLDDEDLVALKAVIERAEVKAKTLSSYLGQIETNE